MMREGGYLIFLFICRNTHIKILIRQRVSVSWYFRETDHDVVLPWQNCFAQILYTSSSIRYFHNKPHEIPSKTVTEINFGSILLPFGITGSNDFVQSEENTRVFRIPSTWNWSCLSLIKARKFERELFYHCIYFCLVINTSQRPIFFRRGGIWEQDN